MPQTKVVITGNDIQVSDGYHTIDELYEHRITLFIALCRIICRDRNRGEHPVWRSKLHSDGSEFEGWFIMGIDTEKGNQLSYHLPVSKWEETDFPGIQTFEKSPEFDGHTSADVLQRIANL